MSTAVGLDIGYTNIRGVLLGGDGRVIRRSRTATDPARTPQRILAQASAMVRELASGEDLSGIGAGIAGQCDAAIGVVRRGPNLWWDDEPFRDRLSAMASRPVVLHNDVQMATLGEWRYGAGKGARDMVCVFTGTGVGGGAVIGGRLLGGTTGCGAHFGHVSVALDGPRCTCGRNGCVESYAGGMGIAARARELVTSEPIAGRHLLGMVGGDADAITAREVSRAASEEDPLAMSIRASAVSALASGTASVVNCFDPELVVLGGSVIQGFRGMFEEVRDGIMEAVLPPIRPSLRISRSQLGDEAGAVGAASLVLRPE